MPDLVVSGSFSEIKNKLLVASSIIKFRKAVGFELFEPDEDWEYISEDDDRVCPVCFDFQRREFKGDMVPAEFEAKQLLIRVGNAVIHPHVHWDPRYSYLEGDCRCRMHLLNVLETFINRLHLELQEATRG